MGNVEIVPVEDSQMRRKFLEFPYSLYRDDPHWVPPLRIAQKQLFDTKKHPFYAHADAQFFLARRGDQVVGRIAAIFDQNFNEFQKDRVGFFGFFESVDSQPVAEALLGAVREWLLKHCPRAVLGPVNPSTNYECGLLVDGFDASPRVMMTYNPRYYPTLMENAGLHKAKDLYCYNTSPVQVLGGKAERVADRALKSRHVRIRPLSMKHFDQEVEVVWQIYSSAWSRNWGFVPMTREEFAFMAGDMKSILVPEFVLVGEVNGRAVGFALALPDINMALKHAGGRLLPLGLLKILYYQRFIRNLRVLALGIVEEFRTAGVAAGFYAALIREARRLHYQDCEISWVLEDNVLMNRSVEALGAKRNKIYRIYEWN